MTRFVEITIRYRRSVIGAIAAITVLLLSQIPSLRVLIDLDAFMPTDPPYVVGSREIEGRFKIGRIFVIALQDPAGDIFSSELPAKVKGISDANASAEDLNVNDVFSLS